ncbi:MAG: DUF393 domain-containing protein [Planctomycetota bacterium]
MTMQVYYDGDCPLCRREIDWLAKRNRKAMLTFVDIAGADFDAALVGKSHEELMGQLHARTADGQWLVGVEVFRRMYSAVGLGFLTSWTRLPIARWVADRAYALFARNRLRWTGRRCNDKVCR